MDDGTQKKTRKDPVLPDRVADAAAVASVKRGRLAVPLGYHESPWMNLSQAAAYLFRGRRFIRKAITDGKLRAAVVGGKREILTRREWCDQYVEEQVGPVSLQVRRRVG